MQWLKLPAWKVGDRGFVPRSDIQISRKQNVSSPLTRKDSVLNFEFYVWLPKNPFILSVYSLHLPLSLNHTKWQSGVFSYKLRYIVGFGLVEMDISTNPKPTIYRNLYENTGPGFRIRFRYRTRLTHSTFPPHRTPQWRLVLYNFMTIEKLGSAADMEKIYRLCDLSRLSPGRARHAGLRLFCKDKRHFDFARQSCEQGDMSRFCERRFAERRPYYRIPYGLACADNTRRHERRSVYACNQRVPKRQCV